MTALDDELAGLARRHAHGSAATVIAKGNNFEWPIWKPEFSEPDDTLDSIAFGFADVLEDFVFDCVTRWDDLRIAKYIIPQRKLPAS